MRLEGWPQATTVQAAILRDTSLRPPGKGLFLRMRIESVETIGFKESLVLRHVRCRAHGEQRSDARFRLQRDRRSIASWHDGAALLDLCRGEAVGTIVGASVATKPCYYLFGE